MRLRREATDSPWQELRRFLHHFAVLQCMVFRSNAHVREESVANLQAPERNSTRLLEREDSRFLDLPCEELQPWLVLFGKRSNQSSLLPDTLSGASNERVREMFEELALPLMREMAEAIFTRDGTYVMVGPSFTGVFHRLDQLQTERV